MPILRPANSPRHFNKPCVALFEQLLAVSVTRHKFGLKLSSVDLIFCCCWWRAKKLQNSRDETAISGSSWCLIERMKSHTSVFGVFLDFCLSSQPADKRPPYTHSNHIVETEQKGFALVWVFIRSWVIFKLIADRLRLPLASFLQLIATMIFDFLATAFWQPISYQREIFRW